MEHYTTGPIQEIVARIAALRDPDMFQLGLSLAAAYAWATKKPQSGLLMVKAFSDLCMQYGIERRAFVPPPANDQPPQAA